MENLIFSLNTVLPIFIVGALGYLLVRRGILSSEFADMASNACFKIFLPVMLFKEVYNSKIMEEFSVSLVLYAIGGIAGVMVVSSLIWPFFIKDRARCGAAVHSTYRSNFVLLGIPILTNMYGSGGTVSAAAVMPFAVTTFNICAVITFVLFSPSDKEVKGVNVGRIAKSIVKNPFIIGISLGFVCLVLGLKLPLFLTKSVDNVASMASPLALLSVGAQFNFAKAKANLRLSSAVSLLRLVVVPLMMTSVGYLLGFRGAELATLYVLFGSPTAVSGASLAYSMGSDGQLTAEITLISAILSAFTFFVGVLLLRAIGAV